MKLIEEPESDFDLEAELPADLAALADQLTADAGFLSDKYPARQPQAWKRSQEIASVEDVSPHAKRKGYSTGWWLRAATIVFVLTGLGTVLNNRSEEIGFCPVAAEVIDNAARGVTENSGVTEINRVPENHMLAAKTPTPVVKERMVLADPDLIPAKATLVANHVGVSPERTFHSFTSAQQEALLDLDASSRSASVDF